MAQGRPAGPDGVARHRGWPWVSPPAPSQRAFGGPNGPPAAVYGQPDNFVAERAQGAKVESRGASGGDLLSTLKDIFAQQAPSEHGWSIDGIMDKLPGAGFAASTQQEVRVAVQALCDDGALYSTVDDDHWSSTA